MKASDNSSLDIKFLIKETNLLVMGVYCSFCPSGPWHS